MVTLQAFYYALKCILICRTQGTENARQLVAADDFHMVFIFRQTNLIL